MFYPNIRTAEFEYFRTYMGFSGHNYDIPFSAIDFSKDFEQVRQEIVKIQDRYFNKAMTSIFVSSVNDKMCFKDVYESSEDEICEEGETIFELSPQICKNVSKNDAINFFGEKMNNQFFESAPNFKKKSVKEENSDVSGGDSLIKEISENKDKFDSSSESSLQESLDYSTLKMKSVILDDSSDIAVDEYKNVP